MAKRIQTHNKKILNEKTQIENIKNCNCRDEKNCPVKNQCLTENVVYKATIDHNNTKLTYIGSTASSFKTRYTVHKHSLTNEKQKNSTALAQFVWSKNVDRKNIKWEIIQKCAPYSPGQKTCSLCLHEKLYIILAATDPKNLNRRSDISNSCPHLKKHKLNKYE